MKRRFTYKYKGDTTDLVSLDHYYVKFLHFDYKLNKNGMVDVSLEVWYGTSGFTKLPCAVELDPQKTYRITYDTATLELSAKEKRRWFMWKRNINTAAVTK